jgi:hypothetical protein
VGHEESQRQRARHAVPLLVEHLNRAFYIIVVPAIVTTFGWVTFGWGWRLAAVITAAEVALVVATVIFLARRQNAQKAALKKAS